MELDKLRELAETIYNDSMALTHSTQRRRFREKEIAKYDKQERYYLNAYVHQHVATRARQAIKDNAAGNRLTRAV